MKNKIALIILLILFSCSFYCQGNSNVEKYIKQQVSNCNKWFKTDSLPQFIFDTVYSTNYYPELKEFGGSTQVAIIEKINNKDLLFRIITDCKKILDIFLIRRITHDVPLERDEYYKYYSTKTLRYIAEYKYIKLFSSKDLVKAYSSSNLDLSQCDRITRIHIKDIKRYEKINYCKGFIFSVILKPIDSMQAVGYKHTAVSVDSITRNYLENFKSIIEYELSHDEIFRKERKITDGVLSKIEKVISNNYNKNNCKEKQLVFGYTGPFFEENHDFSNYNKLFFSEYNGNSSLPYYKLDIIDGQCILVYLEKVYK